MAILPIDGGRYGTPEMTRIFGEQARVDCQLRVEGAVARAQGRIGMIPRGAAASIRRAAASGRVTAARIKKLEERSGHDTAALVEALSMACPAPARPWIHYGLTSADLVDTATSMQMRDALAVITGRISRLGLALADIAERYAAVPAVGRTHGQHASIVPFGLRFANWATECAAHVERMAQMGRRSLVCKTLGVVGTGSLMGAAAPRVQSLAAAELGLSPADAATQVVPRERHAEYVFCLALAGSTLERIATEVRNLQRTEIAEVSERFARGQMGSSAVPVKRNPIKSERVTSLSRLLRAQVQVSLENVPLWHERDLSNSANERFTIPTASILLDDMANTMAAVVAGMGIHDGRIASNIWATGGQIFAEFVLEAMIKRGVPRMEAYRDVQRVAFEASRSGTAFADALAADAAFAGLGRAGISRIFRPGAHLGAGPALARSACRRARRALS
ncbi:MAG: adenylosuccinate lyase [Nitrosopumilus sp.]|nr:adenylosuccinate lyase [Nitrosopumilus sp.]